MPGFGASRPTAPGSFNRPSGNPGLNNPNIRPGIRPNPGAPNSPSLRPSNPSRPGVNLPGNINRPTGVTNLPGNINRPGGANTLPGNVGIRPGINNPVGNRPGGVNTLPGTIGNRPSINFPGNNRPNIGGNLPTSNRPAVGGNLPGAIRPGGGITTLPGNTGGGNRPAIQWPTRPGGGSGNGSGFNVGNGNRPNFGGSGNGSGFNVGNGNRPNINWKPGINNSGNINTIVNNQTQNNFNQQNNTVNNFRTGGGDWGYGNWGGGGYGGNGSYMGRNGWFGNAAANYGSAYCGNYALWNQGYHPWYNGCWSGNNWGNAVGWGLGSAAALGIGAWGLNSMAYNFGYSNYVNPFYSAPAVVSQPYIDYSQPVVNVVQAAPLQTDASAPPAQPAPIPESAAQTFDKATEEFRKGDYQAALASTEQSMKEFPKDPVMHEFRALCLFALRQYAPAAAGVHALLASGPGWNWSTLSSLYPDINVYGKQLNALEDRCTANPNEASSLFLLAYHATTAGDTEMARKVLTKLRKFLPDDSVVSNLWMIAGGDKPVEAAEGTPANPTEKPEKPADQPKEPEPAKDIQLDITGNWKAPKPGGGTIGLTIQADGSFVWSIEDKSGKKDSFDGTFTLDEDLMALNRKSGGALMGKLTALAENSFLFKMVGGPPNDPGLTFKK